MTPLSYDTFRRFRCDDLASVPTLPGLYAWYSVIDAGPPDWEARILEGIDQGAKHSRTVLKSHTAKHRGPDLAIDAQGGFSTTWRGTISDASNGSLQQILDPDPSVMPPEWNEGAEPKLQATLDSPRRRRQLFNILLASSPVLTSPLYIGVAKNLNKRLYQHTQMLIKLSSALRKSSDEFDKVLANPKLKNQFAVRAVERRLSLDDLEVWVLPLESDEHDIQEIRCIAEAAEWLLNRWHRPVLGRK